MTTTIYAYQMHLDDTKISVSLATVQLKAEGARTTLMIAEQGAFFDGYDDAGSREHGTGQLLEALGAHKNQPEARHCHEHNPRPTKPRAIDGSSPGARVRHCRLKIGQCNRRDFLGIVGIRPMAAPVENDNLR